MKKYTGWQWLLIDAANHMGHDKLIFEKRIQWAEDNLTKLEDLADEADTKPLYLKAVMAIRKAQAKQPTGHMVGVDATCSGIQVMSVLTGCYDGALNTGLIDPEVRADAYSKTTEFMNDELGGGLTVPRGDAKASLMTSYYGSKKVPKEIFGEETPELAAFYQAAHKVAPGAWDLLQMLLQSWQPYALEHSWKLPDGFDARVKVMQKQDVRIEVDELDHASFSYTYYENIGAPRGKSNAANVVHSMDAWILRNMHRRCNYDKAMVSNALAVIQNEQIARAMGIDVEPALPTHKVWYYMQQYERSTLADPVILPYLNRETVRNLEDTHIDKLAAIAKGMLSYEPFELVTVHDEFKAHANNINHVRWQYREILAEIADSNVLDDLLSQIYKMPMTFPKRTKDLGKQIRGSAYALC